MTTDIIANQEINQTNLRKAQQIIHDLHNELRTHISNGSGPFLAAIYDQNDNLIAKCSNSVVNETCSHNHAEMNTISQAEKILNTYDLTPHNLKIYITAEPCMMCIGGIMWSGIKEVYYSVPSSIVEQITGFDEGFKPNWFDEFKKRNIAVYGNIELEKGIEVLKEYVNSNKTIYQPQR